LSAGWIDGRGQSGSADQSAGARKRAPTCLSSPHDRQMVALAGPRWLAWLDLTGRNPYFLRQLSAGSGSDYSAVRRAEDESRKHASRDSLRSPETIALRACSKIMLPEGGTVNANYVPAIGDRAAAIARRCGLRVDPTA